MLHGQPHVLFSTRGKVVWRRQSIEIGGWCRVKEAADTQCNGLPIRSHSQKRAQTQHSFAAYHVHTRTRTFAHTHMSDMHTWRGRDKRARMGLRKILVCTREKSNALLIPDGVIHRLLIVLAPHLLSHPARKNKIPCPSHIELHHLSLSLSLSHPPPLPLSPPSLPPLSLVCRLGRQTTQREERHCCGLRPVRMHMSTKIFEGAVSRWRRKGGDGAKIEVKSGEREWGWVKPKTSEGHVQRHSRAIRA